MTTGTGKKKKTKTVYVIASTAGGTAGTFATLHRDPSTGNPGLLDSHGGKVPTGWKVLKVPPRTVVVTCATHTSSVCPGDQNLNGVPPGNKVDYYLFKHGSYPGDRFATDGKYPNMTGKELKLSARRQDFDPTRAADRPPRLQRQGQQDVPAGHARTRRTAARSVPDVAEQQLRCTVCVRDRARQRDAFVAGDRSDAEPETASTRRDRRADHLRPSLDGGEEPRGGAADGRAAGGVQDPRAYRRLGDARQGLAQAGAERGDRRPDRRRALPALPLPVPRPCRGHRPGHLRARSCTRRSCSSASR